MRGKCRPFMSKSFTIWDHFFPLLFPEDSENQNKIGHWTSGSGGKKTFNRSEQMTKIHKKLFFRVIFTQFLRKNVQIWDYFFPIRFPKNSKYLTILDIGLREVWAKGPLNGVNKWEEKNPLKTFFAVAIVHNF